MAISGSLPEIGELSSTADPKVRTLLSELKTATGELEAVQHAVKWYEPKIIATEQTRESTSFGTLATPDEITGVVLPTNGIIRVGWSGVVKCSVAEAGRMALYLGATTVVDSLGVPETAFNLSTGTTSHLWVTSPASTFGGSFTRGFETTGTGTTGIITPFVDFWAAAGTYAIAVKFRATSGSITAKERKLWVEVHGT